MGAIFLVSTSAIAQRDYKDLVKNAKIFLLDDAGETLFLKGNVVFEHENTKMFCDSARYYIKTDQFKAYSRVNINKKDTLNLFCDSLHYSLKKEIAQLYGNVRVRDSEYKLTTDSLEYDVKKSAGIYRNGGRITSILSNEVLSSEIGYFFPNSKNFTFSKDVVYQSNDYKVTTDTLRFNGYSKLAYFYGPTHITATQTNMYCEKGWYDAKNEKGVLQGNAYIIDERTNIAADSVYYSKLDSISEARGCVIIKDTTEKIEFWGDFARSDEKAGFAYLAGHASVLSYKQKDSTFIFADSLFNYMDSLQKSELILAYNNVVVIQNDVQGICDSLSMNQKDSVLHLYKDPMLWSDKTQMSADTLIVHQKNDKIDNIELLQNAIIVNEVEDSLNYYNQVGGKTMHAYFRDDTLRYANVNSNAQTIYYVEKEDKSDTLVVVERSGMARIYGGNITLYFEKQELRRIAYRQNPDGVIYPLNKIKTKEMNVQGFEWKPERRPENWTSYSISVK
ncbi:OstA-like protein [Lishizhenia tianjinensis]|uniref:OstA-like protein n=1 Tax=Lishizhenia tianjinensis TaxID=477690 RepID=A0A1I6YF72_9FLAO|nr:OstA-like protein [Lishizhenia tianjinensis]SFT49176.1 OstA-like protein [Lishizhenia tianjinensis]